jgi:hypothetical protein
MFQYFGLFAMFLVNSFLFNVVYIVFQWLNFNISNTSLCETIGVIMHFFFVASFGLILALATFRLAKIFTIVENHVRYTLSAIALAYGKWRKQFFFGVS